MGLTALCPGTFDPVTNGHVDVLGRASGLFDRVIASVVENPSKEPLFTVEERTTMLKEAVAPMPNVEVASFSGLLVEHARALGATLVIKGIRAVSDFDYEQQMAQMNLRLSGLETCFIPTNPTWSYLSSSLVKEVAKYGGDVIDLVPPHVAERLRERLG